MEIYYMYTKTRKDFGRHALFDDEPSEVRFPPSIPVAWKMRKLTSSLSEGSNGERDDYKSSP